jgi:hypothetical protein
MTGQPFILLPAEHSRRGGRDGVIDSLPHAARDAQRTPRMSPRASASWDSMYQVKASLTMAEITAGLLESWREVPANFIESQLYDPECRSLRTRNRCSKRSKGTCRRSSYRSSERDPSGHRGYDAVRD